MSCDLNFEKLMNQIVANSKMNGTISTHDGRLVGLVAISNPSKSTADMQEIVVARRIYIIVIDS